jgi:hypothetical protein
MMLKAIDRRTHNQYAMEAQLHGVKIPFKYNHDLLSKKSEIEDIQFNQEQAERAMIEAQKRVKSRYV